MPKQFNTRVQNKHDVEANWLKATNFIPLAGEIIIYEPTDDYPTYRFKIGDGVLGTDGTITGTKVNDLSFISEKEGLAIGLDSDALGQAAAMSKEKLVIGDLNLGTISPSEITVSSAVSVGATTIPISIGRTAGVLIDRYFSQLADTPHNGFMLQIGSKYYPFKVTKDTLSGNVISGYSGTITLMDGFSVTEAIASGTKVTEIYMGAAVGEASFVANSKNLALGDNSAAFGNLTRTTIEGDAAFAEGCLTSAENVAAHAEGSGSVASGSASHAEGNSTVASGDYTHAEGNCSQATATYAHAEGNTSIASATSAHAEGNHTQALTAQSHAEGDNTIAGAYTDDSGTLITDGAGQSTHAEGSVSEAYGPAAHAEGQGTKAIGNNAHSEGNVTKAQANSSHAEGYKSLASGVAAHAEGFGGSVASGQGAHAEGTVTTASADSAHSEGYYTTASGSYAHAENSKSTASGHSSHAEGYNTKATGDRSHTEGNLTQATGYNSHAEGNENIVSGSQAHVEGYKNIAYGHNSHAEGHNNQAGDPDNITTDENGNDISNMQAEHAEGVNNKALGRISHVEGTGNTTYAYASHAEGQNNITYAMVSHVEGGGNICGVEGNQHDESNSTYSHVEGLNNTCTGKVSHVGGYKNTAAGDYQTVIGKFNANNINNIFEIGVGISVDDTDSYAGILSEDLHRNALAITKDGSFKLSAYNGPCDLPHSYIEGSGDAIIIQNDYNNSHISIGPSITLGANNVSINGSDGRIFFGNSLSLNSLGDLFIGASHNLTISATNSLNINMAYNVSKVQISGGLSVQHANSIFTVGDGVLIDSMDGIVISGSGSASITLDLSKAYYNNSEIATMDNLIGYGNELPDATDDTSPKFFVLVS